MKTNIYFKSQQLSQFFYSPEADAILVCLQETNGRRMLPQKRTSLRGNREISRHNAILFGGCCSESDTGLQIRLDTQIDTYVYNNSRIVCAFKI